LEMLLDSPEGSYSRLVWAVNSARSSQESTRRSVCDRSCRSQFGAGHPTIHACTWRGEVAPSWLRRTQTADAIRKECI
jgi:hypothetical protein